MNEKAEFKQYPVTTNKAELACGIARLLAVKSSHLYDTLNGYEELPEWLHSAVEGMMAIIFEQTRQLEQLVEVESQCAVLRRLHPADGVLFDGKREICCASHALRIGRKITRWINLLADGKRSLQGDRSEVEFLATVLISNWRHARPMFRDTPDFEHLEVMLQNEHIDAGLLKPVQQDQYVLLDQIAAVVNRSKKTLERQLNNGKMPAANIEGGGGRPSEWLWSKIRPWLESEYGKELPAQFPSLRADGL